MRNDFTRIAVVLDRSGSMGSVREATIAGFNEFIRTQRELPGEALLSLIQFDDQYEPNYTKLLPDVPELTAETFVPRGLTALLDAQGRTITELGRELAAMDEAARPARVVVMTMTDGIENRSTDYTEVAVAALVKEQQEKYGWDFIYLGANQDAVKVATRMHINSNSALTYSANAVGTRRSMAAASNYVKAARSMAPGSARPSFTVEDRKAAVEK
jgi:hypothetical protein